MIDLDAIPHNPGCYLFKDREGNILYVGKARDLKKRVISYFQNPERDSKTSSLVQALKDLDFIVTNTEVEALLLENTLIKKHWPKYNIRLKDSSRYACIHISSDNFPRIRIARKVTNSGCFFGPFTSARERDYVFQVVRKTFGLRTCKNLPKRACLRYHLGHCTGPCIGKISKEDYVERVTRAKSALGGKIEELIIYLSREMKESADSEQFERARELRDEITALERLSEKQNVDRKRKLDQDVLIYTKNEGNIFLILFHVYKGTLEGKEEFVFPSGTDIIDEFIVQYYSNNAPPEELIVQSKLDASIQDFLTHLKKKKS